MPGTTISTEETPRSASGGLPIWLLVLGFPLILGTIPLTARLVWEQTVWTWRDGPQMVGFSLAHGYGAFLMLFPLLLVPWLAVAAIVIVWSSVKKRSIPRTNWIVFGLGIAGMLLLAVPYGYWQRLFAHRLAGSPHAGEFLAYAAADGDLGLVKTLVSHGVPVDAYDREGNTGLHNAATAGQIHVLEYLVSRGANLNAIDRYGDSPLEKADFANQQEAVDFLSALGAERIRGDQEQREKAMEEMFRESYEYVVPGDVEESP